MRASALTEWTLYQGQTRIVEALAPKFTSGFSTLSTLSTLSTVDIDIDIDIDDGVSGVLYCVGGISGGFSVYMDEGFLKAEYNMLGIYRYKASSEAPMPAGHHQIQVEVLYDERRAQAPATITLRVDGSDVGMCRVEQSVQAGFTAFETFDVGIDLGSPVALDYHKRSPFAFEGTIDKVHIAYI